MSSEKRLPPGEVGPVRQVHGRGAVNSPAPRFEPRHVVLDDGWADDPDFRPPVAVSTTVTPEVTRGILAKNDSPDVPFDRSINPYKGCEHGCVYCFARPTHSYLGLSPGLDFESRLFAKPEAATLLEREQDVQHRRIGAAGDIGDQRRWQHRP